jgi:hemoglobin-like flavoprotein
LNHSSFRVHADNVVDTIDRSVSNLGPDIEMLEKEMIALGRRHMHVGVQAEDLVYMGRAIQYAVEDVLGDELLIEERLAWTEVLAFMIEKMTVGMLDF